MTNKTKLQDLPQDITEHEIGKYLTEKDKSTLQDLPKDITEHEIGKYLTEKDKSTLALTSKTTQGLFQPHRLQMMLNKLLLQVMHGEQDKAEKILKCNPKLLEMTGEATDYSGRTFNCTAYEYAYWAKDTHMCRMLERHMDENTKAAMLVKVTAIDTVGLTYEQHGHVVEHSTHFDMTPLKTALQNYVNGFDAWDTANNYDAMRAAWMQVGLAQRDLPVHVVNEYCRPDRSFAPLPAFNEDKLPRVLTYYNLNSDSDVPLFPLVVSGSSGLGVNFALISAASAGTATWRVSAWGRGGRARVRRCLVDLAAISRLDVVRTDDLKQSLEILGKPEDLEHAPGFR